MLTHAGATWHRLTRPPRGLPVRLWPGRRRPAPASAPAPTWVPPVPLPTDGRPVELSGQVGICHVRTTAGEVWAETELYAGVFGTLGLIAPPEKYRTAGALLGPAPG